MIISWDKHKLADLKATHATAVQERAETFVFVEFNHAAFIPTKVAEHELDTYYAKYLIQFLDSRLNAIEREYPPNREGQEGE